MAASLNSEETRHEAINILRTLIDRIVLHPGEGRGEMAIELHGDLAAILAFGNGKGIPNQDVGLMVVAGAGFEPAISGL